MTDDTVRDALRSDAPLVVVEAPAGCGKTHQAADYAREIADTKTARLLILTHTHAACSMFADRTKGMGARLEIRTIDSVIGQIAAAYHAGLGIPADPGLWIRQQEAGYAKLAIKVSALLQRHPMIAASLARRYPVVICDEHQDSSGDQHALAMALLEQGARLRIFADPMQEIFKDDDVEGACARYDWEELKGKAQRFEILDVPHRWEKGCPLLGQWTLKAREALKMGGKVNLKSLPPSVSVVVAENRAQRNLEYQLSGTHRKPVDAFECAQSSLLIITRYNDTARSFRGFFNRCVPLWEGHTRGGLEKLVDAIAAAKDDRGALATAVVQFMADVGKGFSPSGFGDRFEQEARDGCKNLCRGKKPAVLQELARFLVSEPDHRGIAKMLRRLWELKRQEPGFSDIEIDRHKEFWDAVSLGDFATAEDGLAEITHRRTYARPKPPAKAISIIHKAKGLECESVIVMPCDAMTFRDTMSPVFPSFRYFILHAPCLALA